MKVRLVFVIYFLSSFISIYGNTPTPDQIEQKLDECYTILIEKNPEDAFLCLERLKPEILQSGYGKGIVRFYTQLSEYYLFKGEHQKSLDLISEGLKKHKKLLSEEEKNRFQVLEIRILQELGNDQEVLLRIKDLLPDIQSPRHKAALLSMRAFRYSEMGEYDLAMNDYYSALKIFENQKDTSNTITILNRQGLLNQHLKEYEKALQNYTQALQLAEMIKSKTDLQTTYANLGTYYKQLGRFDDALENYNKSAAIAEVYNNPNDLARILLNTGDVYLQKNDFEKAYANYQKSLVISKEAGIPIGILYNYNSLGMLHTKTKNYKAAKKDFDSALGYARKLNLPALEAEIYHGFYTLFEEKKDFENALFYHIKSDSIKNNLFTEEKQKVIAELEIRYETELKDQKIETIHQAFEKKKAQNRTLIFGLIFLAITAGLFVFFMIYRHKTLRKLYDRNIEFLNAMNFYKITPEKTDERDQLKKVFDRILKLLDTDKVFKDPNLSIKNMAGMAETNEKYVSTAIATYAKMNYSNFINFYRTNEAKELITKNETANLSEIMYDCGFNSRTTFYNAFKKFTGLSPKQFKEMKSIPVEI